MVESQDTALHVTVSSFTANVIPPPLLMLVLLYVVCNECKLLSAAILPCLLPSWSTFARATGLVTWSRRSFSDVLSQDISYLRKGNSFLSPSSFACYCNTFLPELRTITKLARHKAIGNIKQSIHTGKKLLLMHLASLMALIQNLIIVSSFRKAHIRFIK